MPGGGASGGGGDARSGGDARLDTFGAEAGLVRIVALMAHRAPAVQARVRTLGALPSVLSCCQPDDHNPFIREWAVLAIRNLTEGCTENQAEIAKLETSPRGVANPELLADAGIELDVDRASGKVRMKPVT